ncbi:MAG: alpha/beta hydrolase [Chloroflexi bacterium]|nr:alpha/beta hydrolase [Chloroflexota bacterium]
MRRGPTSVEPRHGYLWLGALRLHFLEWGHSVHQTLLLLHGLTNFARSWEPLALALRERYHILALDQRGHGDSAWASDGAYTIEDHISDIQALVEILGLRDMILIGHSMGARHALMYSALYPQRTSRLILIEGRPDDDAQVSETIRQTIIAMPEVMGSRKEVEQEIRRLLPLASPRLIQFLVGHSVKPFHNSKLTWKFDRAIRDKARQGPWRVVNLWPLVELICCPTLIVRGAESSILTDAGSRQMQASIAGSQLIEIEGASHTVPQDKPLALIEAIRQFLEP